MSLWLKVFIILLAVHYIFAIGVLYLVLKDNLRAGVKPKVAKLVSWNVIVLFLLIVGPIAYLLYRLIAKPQKMESLPKETPPVENNTIEPMASDTVASENKENAEHIEQTEQSKREKSEDE